MTPQEVAESIRAIDRAIEFDGGGNWEYIDQNALRTWGGQVLSRIAALLGTEKIELGSGFVTEDPSLHGDVALFTKSRLLRATFDVANGQLGSVRIRAVPRKAVTSFTVLDASHYSVGREPWPSKFRVEVEVTGDDSFELPLSRWHVAPLQGLSEFVSGYFL